MAYLGNSPLNRLYSSQAIALAQDQTAVTVSYTPGLCLVFKNGALLDPGVDYTATDGSVITLASAASTGDVLRVLNLSQFAFSAVAGEANAGMIKIATTALAQALTDDATALTPKKLADVFGLRVGHTFTANDWAPLGGGLIIQWGIVVAPTTAPVSVTFPIAFPNNVFSLAGAPKSAGSSWDGFEYDALTTTGFNFAHIFNGAQSAGTTAWFAIGN